MPPGQLLAERPWLQPMTQGDAVAAAGVVARQTSRGPEVTGAHGLGRLLSLHRSGASLATIAAALNADGFRTPSGARWHRTTVARAVADAAYPSLGAMR